MTDAEKALNALDAWIISRSTGDAAIESDYAKKMVPAVRKALQRVDKVQGVVDALKRIVGTPGNSDHRQIAQQALAAFGADDLGVGL